MRTACLHIRIHRVHIYQRFYCERERTRVSVSDNDDHDDRCSDSIEISVLIELVNMRKTLRWHLNIAI